MFNVWAPKIAAFLAALAVTYGAKYGLTLSESELTVIFLAVLGTVKTILNHWLNPANAASGELALKGVQEKREMKAAKVRRTRNGGF